MIGKKNKEMYIKISGDKEIKPDKPNLILSPFSKSILKGLSLTVKI